MTLFILVSYVYPNGQNLRPDLSGESGVFVSAVRYLYKIDTPTNIFQVSMYLTLWQAA